jgi:hypothetical protein
MMAQRYTDAPTIIKNVRQGDGKKIAAVKGG